MKLLLKVVISIISVNATANRLTIDIEEYICKSNIEELTKFLNKDRNNVNSINELGETILIIAAQNLNINLSYLLLNEYNANKEIRDLDEKTAFDHVYNKFINYVFIRLNKHQDITSIGNTKEAKLCALLKYFEKIKKLNLNNIELNIPTIYCDEIAKQALREARMLLKNINKRKKYTLFLD